MTSQLDQPGWMKSGTMDGGSLNTAYIAISECLELIRLMLPLTVCHSGQLPLQESTRLLERRDPCLRHRDSGDTPLTNGIRT
jgi:hypothetical protein